MPPACDEVGERAGSSMQNCRERVAAMARSHRNTCNFWPFSRYHGVSDEGATQKQWPFSTN
jgi:hypothetical protein